MPLTEITSHAQQLIKAAIGPSKFLDTPDIEKAVDSAILAHSVHLPNILIIDAVSDGERIQSFPAQYVKGFARKQDILIEFPVDQVPQQFVHDTQWTVIQQPAGDKIGFASPPQNAAAYRVHLPVVHEITVGATTATAIEEEALAHLAANKACLMLSTAYGHTKSPMIAADSVDFESKMADFRSQANKFLKEYETILAGNHRLSRHKGAVVHVTAGLSIEKRVGRNRQHVNSGYTSRT